MRVFPPRYAPDLLDRVKIRRIRWQLDKSHLLPDILIFRQHFRFYKTHCFLVPRGVIHYQRIFFPFWCWVRYEKCPYGVNRCPVVECLWLGGKKLPALRDDKSTVGYLEPARKRFYRRGTPLFVPARSHRGLYLKMNLILVYKDQGFVLFNFAPFFLKASRSSVSS